MHPPSGIEIDWRAQEEQVRRLRQRIFKAAQEQDWPKVRNLQKLMLRSRANTLVSVRQVTQRNAGRRTAGIDGEVALTPEARAEVAVRVHQSITSWNPRAVRRVYIPKASNRAKLRPLGIPVIMDRCHQARVRHALEPEWEARFEPRSYGFRPGRGCHDAIAAIYNACKGPTARRVWALDADLAAAFDRIDHDHLLASLGSFPARDMIRGWLKAGVFEAGKGFAPTVEGTPQGGVISPVPAERRAARAGGGRRGPLPDLAARAPGTPSQGPRSRSGTPMTWSCSATASSRPNMSRRGSRSGWRPGAWPSTRTRRVLSTSARASTSSGSTSAATPTASC